MGSLLCCFGMQACQCCCTLFSNTIGTPRHLYYRIGYVTFTFLWFIIGLFLLFNATPLLSKYYLDRIINCSEESGIANLSCIAQSIILRLSLVLSIFYLLFAFLCLIGGSVISSLNDGIWLGKFLIVLFGFLFTFYFSNTLILKYTYFCMAGSTLFQILEAFFIVALAYDWNSKWVSNYDTSSNDKIWAILLILFTVISYLIGLIITLDMSLYYAFDFWDYLIISFNLFSCLLSTALVLLGRIQGGSIFTCAIVYAFNSSNIWSAFLSNPIIPSDQYSNFQNILLGMLLIFILLMYISLKTVDQASSNSQNNIMVNATELVIQQGPTHQPISSNDLNDVPDVSIQASAFHLAMMLCCLYMPMLFTNWGSSEFYDSSSSYFEHTSTLSYFSKVCGGVVSNLLFLFTQFAPILFPNRDFGR